MGCFIFDHCLISFHDIDILYIGFLMFHQFPPQFYHFVIVVTQFCDVSPFSHQFSGFWWFLFFTLFFIIFHNVCRLFFEMMFFRKMGEMRFRVVSKQFFWCLPPFRNYIKKWFRFSPESRISCLCHFDFIYDMLLFKNVNLV